MGGEQNQQQQHDGGGDRGADEGADQADKGGHFAAFEQPEIMMSEIRTGLRSLRA